MNNLPPRGLDGIPHGRSSVDAARKWVLPYPVHRAAPTQRHDLREDLSTAAAPEFCDNVIKDPGRIWPRKVYPSLNRPTPVGKVIALRHELSRADSHGKVCRDAMSVIGAGKDPRH